MSVFKRVLNIIRVLLTYFVLHKFSQRHVHKTLGQRLREACEQLGPTFIKIGQLLSSRYELIAENDAAELRKLLDKVQPLPSELVREIIRHDLGNEPEKLFRNFESKPLASASIAQVHLAQLSDGTRVVVKIRRPFIGKIIKTDLSILRGVISFAELFSPTLRHIHATRIVDQFHDWLMQEINFRQEAKNILSMKKYYAFAEKNFRHDLGRVITPKLFQKYCSDNIVIMEFIEGVQVKDFKTVLNEPEYDIHRSLKTLLCSALRPLFDYDTYLFHADPHPANLFLLKHGNIAYVDYGLVCAWDFALVKKARRLFIAVYARNEESTIRETLRMCNADYEKYAPRLKNDVKRYLTTIESQGIGYWFMTLIKILVKHRVPFPHHLVLFGRANLIFDGIVNLVLPGKTTTDLVGHELRRAVIKQVIEDMRKIDYGPLVYNLSTKITQSPAVINKLIDRYFEDPLRIIRDVKNAASVP